MHELRNLWKTIRVGESLLPIHFGGAQYVREGFYNMSMEGEISYNAIMGSYHTDMALAHTLRPHYLHISAVCNVSEEMYKPGQPGVTRCSSLPCDVLIEHVGAAHLVGVGLGTIVGVHQVWPVTEDEPGPCHRQPLYLQQYSTLPHTGQSPLQLFTFDPHIKTTTNCPPTVLKNRVSPGCISLRQIFPLVPQIRSISVALFLLLVQKLASVVQSGWCLFEQLIR